MVFPGILKLQYFQRIEMILTRYSVSSVEMTLCCYALINYILTPKW